MDMPDKKMGNRKRFLSRDRPEDDTRYFTVLPLVIALRSRELGRSLDLPRRERDAAEQRRQRTVHRDLFTL